MSSHKAAPRLPPEMLCRIVEYTPRPSDLKSLCLVTKEFRDAATPALYHTIVLDEKTTQWPKLRIGRGLLSVGNGGLAHKISDFANIPLDAATVTTLFTQQSRLQSLALGPIVADLDKHLQLNAFGLDRWSSLRELRIPTHIWNKSDLDAYGVIIKNAPQLSHLSIHCRQLMETNNGFIQSADAKKNDIFSRVFTGKDRNPLSSLHLDGVDLSVVAFNYPRYFDPCRLQELHISACTNWSFFLQTFAECFTETECNLRNFSVEVGIELDPVRVLEEFLCSFTGLEAFRYSDQRDGYSGEVAWGLLYCLEGHLSSLKQLTIVPGDGRNCEFREIVLEVECLEKISTRCTNLRQLGIVMPPTSTSGAHKHHSCYSRTLLKLLQLPSLRVLRILNWPETLDFPTVSPSYHLLERMDDEELVEELNMEIEEQVNNLHRSMFLQQMDIFAAGLLPQAFRAMRKTHDLPIVCFTGFKGNQILDDAGMEVSPDAACYVPVRHIDIFGAEAVTAQRVPLIDARYLEPENEILRWRHGD
ncbi:hypothetical protein PRZ48_003099 [Zasmidium cellare]|uniref:F-box domain-containing protein n=1 Tax=Zasmidium cellare TaxID=395010 RepID=A0ABR0EVB6_ZASCE|nr:hypothetical protein PRZ48_003099 [Zasmidium cellare]